MVYLGSGNWQMLNYQKFNGQPLQFSSNFLQGYINGCILSTAGGSGTMSIAACEATDSTNAQVMIGAASSKTTASWTVGSGNGGLDTGSIANTTWYHFYEIVRPDTGVVDYIFSTSASSPTLPANYTLYRRIGSGRTDGSAHWLAFTQYRDKFIWAAAVVDLSNGASTSASRTLQTLTVPTGVVVTALFRGNVSASAVTYRFSSPAENDVAVTAGQNTDLGNGSAAVTLGGQFQVVTNTSAQIGVRSPGAAGAGLYLETYGWIDDRGKQ